MADLSLSLFFFFLFFSLQFFTCRIFYEPFDSDRTRTCLVSPSRALNANLTCADRVPDARHGDYSRPLNHVCPPRAYPKLVLLCGWPVIVIVIVDRIPVFL